MTQSLSRNQNQLSPLHLSKQIPPSLTLKPITTRDLRMHIDLQWIKYLVKARKKIYQSWFRIQLIKNKKRKNRGVNQVDLWELPDTLVKIK